jgi:hypothetical protein
MFLNQIILQATIIIGVFIVFVVTYLLNKKIKPPKNIVLPEKCSFCTLSSCIIKMSDVEKTKEELRKIIDCEKEVTINEKK